MTSTFSNDNLRRLTINIFVTDPDPHVCARNLDDSRVIKQMLESVQMLCTVADADGHSVPYKPTHINHPCVRWLRNHKGNFYWLVAHAYALSSEYTERFDRIHASDPVLFDLMKIYGYEKHNVLGFQNSARNKEHGLDYTHIKDVFTAYRLYLDARWNKAIRDHALNPRKRLPRWTGKMPPSWYTVTEI